MAGQATNQPMEALAELRSIAGLSDAVFTSRTGGDVERTYDITSGGKSVGYAEVALVRERWALTDYTFCFRP